MRRIALMVAAMLIVANAAMGGVSWKAIWLEPFEIILESGQSTPYAVKGLRLGDVEADITTAPSLRIASVDPEVVSINARDHMLTAKRIGHTQIRISFNQITVSYEAYVVAEK